MVLLNNILILCAYSTYTQQQQQRQHSAHLNGGKNKQFPTQLQNPSSFQSPFSTICRRLHSINTQLVWHKKVHFHIKRLFSGALNSVYPFCFLFLSLFRICLQYAAAPRISTNKIHNFSPFLSKKKQSFISSVKGWKKIFLTKFVTLKYFYSSSCRHLRTGGL